MQNGRLLARTRTDDGRFGGSHQDERPRFFVPLDSAGLKARVEGVMSVKTLSKEEVDHLVNEDGAKFDNINKDGTVTEISFEATGVELSKN